MTDQLNKLHENLKEIKIEQQESREKPSEFMMDYCKIQKKETKFITMATDNGDIVCTQCSYRKSRNSDSAVVPDSNIKDDLWQNYKTRLLDYSGGEELNL